MLLSTLFCKWLDDKLYMQKKSASAPAIILLHLSIGGEEEYVGMLCWWGRRNSSWFRRHRTWVLHVQIGGCKQFLLGLDFFQWKCCLPNDFQGVVVPLGDELVYIYGLQFLHLWVFPWAGVNGRRPWGTEGRQGQLLEQDPNVTPWWDTCASCLYLQSYVSDMCMFLSLVSKTLIWCRRQLFKLIAVVQPNHCSCSLKIWWKMSVSDEPPKWCLCHAAARISMATSRNLFSFHVSAACFSV